MDSETVASVAHRLLRAQDRRDAVMRGGAWARSLPPLAELDIMRKALNAYSEVYEHSRHLQRDHEDALRTALADVAPVLAHTAPVAARDEVAAVIDDDAIERAAKALYLAMNPHRASDDWPTDAVARADTQFNGGLVDLREYHLRQARALNDAGLLAHPAAAGSAVDSEVARCRSCEHVVSMHQIDGAARAELAELRTSRARRGAEEGSMEDATLYQDPDAVIYAAAWDAATHQPPGVGQTTDTYWLNIAAAVRVGLWRTGYLRAKPATVPAEPASPVPDDMVRATLSPGRHASVSREGARCTGCNSVFRNTSASAQLSWLTHHECSAEPLATPRRATRRALA